MQIACANDYYHFTTDSSLEFLNENIFIRHIEKTTSSILLYQKNLSQAVLMLKHNRFEF